MEDKREFLETKARQARELALTVIASFGNGHVGGSMSIMDALAVLFYDAMRLDDQDPDWSHQKLDNLTVLLDYNKGQIDGFVADIEAVAPHEPKWEAFGWDVQRVDGHDVLAAAAAIEKAKTVSGKPQLIVLIRSRARALCRLKESLLPTPWPCPKNRRPMPLKSWGRDIRYAERSDYEGSIRTVCLHCERAAELRYATRQNDP